MKRGWSLVRRLRKMLPPLSCFTTFDVKKLLRKPFPCRFRRPRIWPGSRFLSGALRAIWKSHIEPGYRNNSAIRLASELRLLGLSEDEANDKYLSEMERNGIQPTRPRRRNKPSCCWLIGQTERFAGEDPSS
jgi:hypothetical protein